MTKRKESYNKPNKYVFALVLALLLATAASGCASSSESGSGGKDAATPSDPSFFDRIGKYLDAKGRPYGNTAHANVGETLSNSFFAWTVENVRSADILLDGDEEVLPVSGEDRFVVADIKTTNISDAEIPVGNYDFTILWEDEAGQLHEDNAFEFFMEGMYPNEATEQPQESLSGMLVFEAPKTVTFGTIAYYEYYEDEFEGDAHMFSFDLAATPGGITDASQPFE